jgi:hypothetical protein
MGQVVYPSSLKRKRAMDAVYQYYGIALGIYLVLIYFAVGLFTHHLEMKCGLLKILAILPVEEIIFWPFHSDVFYLWKSEWKYSVVMRDRMFLFFLVLAAFSFAYVCLITDDNIQALFAVH